jgi:hypothetical protein
MAQPSHRRHQGLGYRAPAQQVKHAMGSTSLAAKHVTTASIELDYPDGDRPAPGPTVGRR